MKRLFLGVALLGAAASPLSAQTYVSGVRGTLQDYSGTVTTANTSQVAIPQNDRRVFFSCQNPIAATETLFVNVDFQASTTGGSYEVAPGGSISFPNNYIPIGPVSVTAATAGHRFICKSGGG